MKRTGFPFYISKPDGYPANLLFERLRNLNLPRGQYAVFGSGPLAIRGLIKRVGDLDVLVRDQAWNLVVPLGRIVRYGSDETIDLDTGLTFGRSWAYGDFDIDRLIDEAEWIEGLPFVTLDAVVEFKRIAGRPKDLEHLRLLEGAGLI